MPKKQLFDLEQTLAGVRSVAEMIDRRFASNGKDFAIVGIHQMGVPLAKLICAELEKLGDHLSNIAERTPEIQKHYINL
jgi:pyrimidine operon attenuation protein/uracil phosphoribosyltransferase